MVDAKKFKIQLKNAEKFRIDLRGDIMMVDGNNVHIDTKENWDSMIELVAKKDHIYVYLDYARFDSSDIPGIKVGDGTSYLIDLPFVSGNNDALNAHISNRIVHITDAERESWNNKVTCYISGENPDTLVFSK